VARGRRVDTPDLIADLLAEAGVQSGADAVLSTSKDGWTCGTPIEALTDDRDALLAVALDGRPLPIEHGFPVRMIVPGLYDYNDPRDGDWEYAKNTRFSSRHEMLTGTQPDGTAFTDSQDHTCDNWTSNKSPDPGTSGGDLNASDGRLNAQIGFPDRNGGGNGSWNSAHGTRGCAQADLPKTHGQGLFYCFATN